MSYVRRATFAAGAVSLVALLLPGAAVAQTANVSPELEARIVKEKENRKACKIEICKAFATPSEGAPITCSVTKTWLAADIQAAYLRDKLSWPWGHAQCSSDIELDRRAIQEAALQPS